MASIAPPALAPSAVDAATHRFERRLVAATCVPWLLVVAGNRTAPGLVAVPLLLLGTTHVAATAGFYADPDARPHLRAHPVRYLWAPLGLVVASILAFGFVPPRVGTWMVAGFLAWQSHHFARQNLGCFAFWCRARGLAGPTSAERRAVALTGYAAMAGVARQATIHTWAGNVFWPLAAVLLLTAAAVAFADRPQGPRRVALAALLLFFAPTLLPVGLLALAAAGSAAHGAQYYLMMHEVTRPQVAARRAMVLAVVVGAIVVFLLSGAATFGPDRFWIGAVKGVVAAHFVIDAGVWKLRDPQQRAFMQARFGFL